jgi:hypothetical protein
MMEETHDWRCTVTLLLDDVTEEQARAFFAEGIEVKGVHHPVNDRYAVIETPGLIVRQP